MTDKEQALEFYFWGLFGLCPNLNFPLVYDLMMNIVSVTSCSGGKLHW